MDEEIAQAVERSTDPNPPPGTLASENPDLSRKVADDVRRTAQKAHKFEMAFVGVAALCFCVAATAFTVLVFRLSHLAEQNRTGVVRIVDCTTAGRPCYEDQQSRSDMVVADALLQLNQEHIAIECILLKLPTSRTQADIDECRAEAKAETDKARVELHRQLELARKAAVDAAVNATTTTTTGK